MSDLRRPFVSPSPVKQAGHDRLHAFAASTVSRIGRLRSFARPSIPSMRDRHRFVIRFGVSFTPGYGGGLSRVRR